MYYYLNLLLRKHPGYLIVQVGTDDCTMRSSDKVLNDLLLFKRHKNESTCCNLVCDMITMR